MSSDSDSSSSNDDRDCKISKRDSGSESECRGKHQHKKDKARKKEDKKDKKKKDKKKKDKKQKRQKCDSVPVKISEDDYFKRSAEFQTWLHEKHGSYLDEIPSEDARRAFKRFVSKWNDGELPAKFYNGIPVTAVPAASRTRHKWKFAETLSSEDQLALDSTKDRVDSQTQKQDTFAPTPSAPTPPLAQQHQRDQRLHHQQLPRVPTSNGMAMKRHRENIAMVIDELAPKADAGSREALLEKRRQVDPNGQPRHALNTFAKRDEAGGLEQPESEIMSEIMGIHTARGGGGGDDFVAQGSQWDIMPDRADLVRSAQPTAGLGLPQNVTRGQKLRDVVMSDDDAMTDDDAMSAKKAIVIGISSYSRKPLANALHDAQEVHATLERMGFASILVENCDIGELDDAVRKFVGAIQEGDIGLFYFAGHGVEYKDTNWLISKDMPEYEEDLPRKALDAQDLLERMKTRGTRFNLVILDCCRARNQLKSSTAQMGLVSQYRNCQARSCSDGLTAMKAPEGSMICFACAPGQLAADGGPGERHSVFTKHLLLHLDKVNLRVEDLFIRVTAGVVRDTRGKQSPYTNSSLTIENASLCAEHAVPQPECGEGRIAAGGPSSSVPIQYSVIRLCLDGDVGKFNEQRFKKALAGLLKAEIDPRHVELKRIKRRAGFTASAVRIQTGRCNIRVEIDESGFAQFYCGSESSTEEEVDDDIDKAVRSAVDRFWPKTVKVGDIKIVWVESGSVLLGLSLSTTLVLVLMQLAHSRVRELRELHVRCCCRRLQTSSAACDAIRLPLQQSSAAWDIARLDDKHDMEDRINFLINIPQVNEQVQQIGVVREPVAVVQDNEGPEPSAHATWRKRLSSALLECKEPIEHTLSNGTEKTVGSVEHE
mmetsp:Transcript_5193/g.8717  ORF Transcript_5193/g.8717 Transcript_5193/m.8717 type:complete len:882 (-) Transcript_5193:89-2734(-)